MKQANDDEKEQEHNAEAAPLSPLPPSQLHTLDCSLLKKLASGCKLDKARIGVIRMMIRCYRRQQVEKREEVDAREEWTIVEPDTKDDAAAIFVPTYHDVAHLIGHPPPPPSPGVALTSHQLDWIDIRKYLTKIVPSDPNHKDYMDIDAAMKLLAQIESNSFGLFATKEKAAEGEKKETEADSADDDISAAAAATPTVSSAASAASSTSPLAAAPKYIGVQLFPTASYFNHSCDSNVRVVQTGTLLTFTARRDISQGEELCISYIDTNIPMKVRR